MPKPEQITIECISYKQVRVLCDGEWRTIDRYDKGFSDIYKCFHVARIAHGIKSGCQHTRAMVQGSDAV